MTTRTYEQAMAEHAKARADEAAASERYRNERQAREQVRKHLACEAFREWLLVTYNLENLPDDVEFEAEPAVEGSTDRFIMFTHYKGATIRCGHYLHTKNYTKHGDLAEIPVTGTSSIQWFLRGGPQGARSSWVSAMHDIEVWAAIPKKKTVTATLTITIPFYLKDCPGGVWPEDATLRQIARDKFSGALQEFEHRISVKVSEPQP